MIHSREEVTARLGCAGFVEIRAGGGPPLRLGAERLQVDADLTIHLSLPEDSPLALTAAGTLADMTIGWRVPGTTDAGEVEVSGALAPAAGAAGARLSALEGTGVWWSVRPATLVYRVFEETARGIAPTIMRLDAAPEPAVAPPVTLGNKLKLWIAVTRPPFFTASVVPVLLGSTIAWATEGGFHWGFFLLALFAGMLVHAGTNVANDFYDYRSGDDNINTDYIRPFSGGTRFIQRGLMSPRAVLIEALVLFAAGSVIGFYLTWARGWAVLWIGAIGVFSGFFYTAPPFRLAGRGVGELLIGLNFGVLMTLGAFYVQAQELAWQPVLAAVPVSLLIAAVVYINEFPDFVADRDSGKSHLVVRMGRDRAVHGYALMMMVTYLSILVGVVAHVIPGLEEIGLPWLALLGLLTVPTAVKAVRVAYANYMDYRRLVPANAATIMIHMATGSLLVVGFFLYGLVN
jgi:1,4-dihydroxy-2-naphthoate octaprenyltransferase